MAKAVAGLMETVLDAEKAIRELVADGFKRDDIKIMVEEGSPAPVAPQRPQRPPRTATISGLQQEEKVLRGGDEVERLAWGSLGVLTGAGIPERQARSYTEGVKRGGTLVLVHCDEDRVARAAAILSRNGATDIENLLAVLERERPERRVGEGDPHAVAGRGRIGDLAPEEYPHPFEAAAEPVRGWPEERRETVRLERPEAREPLEDEVGGSAGLPAEEREYLRHFSATYGGGERFDEYRSAYHYAEGRSGDRELQEGDWPEVEETIHREWERTHPGSWLRFKEAIHFGWNKSHRHH